MALTTYPLNEVDYQAEDAELFHCTRSSGIYAGDDFSCTATGADNTIVVGVGLAWLRTSRFSGKVAALREALSLDLGVPDSTYPRIDAVAIQFDANQNATNVVVKQGTASSSPVAPEVSRTEALYELHLYHVRREAGAAAITAANITDLRLSSAYCGLMADSVTSVDTDAIYAQATALRMKSFYPTWDSCVKQGTVEHDKPGFRFSYGDKLFSCISPNPTFQADWIPGVGTESMYTEVCETHAGTEEDPIPYSGNMILEQGKYYMQDYMIYLCTRDTEIAVYQPLSELVGIYVEEA